jgi:hypothetical protein
MACHKLFAQILLHAGAVYVHMNTAAIKCLVPIGSVMHSYGNCVPVQYCTPGA